MYVILYILAYNVVTYYSFLITVNCINVLLLLLEKNLTWYDL